jgi:hypothetical protein
MATRIEGTTAYVDSIVEAFEACELPGVKDVVIEDNAERLKMQRLMKGLV